MLNKQKRSLPVCTVHIHVSCDINNILSAVMKCCHLTKSYITSANEQRMLCEMFRNISIPKMFNIHNANLRTWKAVNIKQAVHDSEEICLKIRSKKKDLQRKEETQSGLFVCLCVFLFVLLLFFCSDANAPHRNLFKKALHDFFKNN